MKRWRANLFLTGILLLGLCSSEQKVHAQSNPSFFNFEGELLDSSGNTVLDNNVDFVVGIYDPAESCLLYEEEFLSLDLSTSFGKFNLVVGSAAGSRTPDDRGLPTKDVFANHQTYGSVAFTCPSGYNPASGDHRVVKVYVNAPSVGNETLPTMALGSVPSALVAETLQGKSPSDFIQAITTVTQSNLTSLTDGTDVSSTLHHHDTHNDTRYVQKGSGSNQDFGSGNLSTTGSLGIGITTPAANIEIEDLNPTLRLDVSAGGSNADLEFFSGATEQARISSPQGSSQLKFSTGGTDALILDPAQNATFMSTLQATIIAANPSGAGAGQTGEIRMRELSANGINHVGIKAPDNIATDLTWTLPNVDGTSTQVMTTDGAGTLYWSTPSGAGDVTDVIAGGGLTGGATSGAATLDIGAGTGIIVNANDIAVNVGTGVNQIVQLDGSAKLPAIDGSNLSNVNGTDASRVLKSGDTMTGPLNLDNQQELRLSEPDGAGSEYIALKAPSSLASNSSYTFPAVPLNGQYLTTDGSGVLSWVTPTVGSTEIVNNEIVDADINTTAAITRSKLANGSPNRIVVNNPSGVMIDGAAITNNRALVSDTNGIPTESTVTTTELGYLSGVTSTVQTQIDNQVAVAGDTMTGPLSMGNGNATLSNSDTAAQPALTWQDDLNTGLFSPAANEIAFSAGGSEKLILKSTGDVGIGTSSPSGKLDIEGGDVFIGTGTLTNGSPGEDLSVSGNVEVDGSFFGTIDPSAIITHSLDQSYDDGSNITVNSSDVIFNLTTSNDFLVRDNFLPGFAVIDSGNVGIGTESPAAKLHVSGNEVIFGSGEGTSPTATTLRGPAASGSNISGGNWLLDASTGTGNQGSGDFIFRVAREAPVRPEIDSYSSANTGGQNATSLTWSHTVGPESNNRALIVGLTTPDATTITGVTFDSAAMTLINQNTNGNNTSLWWLAAPSIGTHNVVATIGGSKKVNGIAVSLYHVNQGSPTQITNSGNSALPKANVTGTATSDLVLGIIGQDDILQFSKGPISDLVTAINDTNSNVALVKTPGNGGAVEADATLPSATAWSVIAVPLALDQNPLPSATDPNVLTERMRIKNDGRVGIGTSSPLFKLHVVGTAGKSSGTSWINASDGRLKNVTGDYEYGLSEILKLNPVRFHYKDRPDLGLTSENEVVGFIAQEVKTVIPEAVSTDENGYLRLDVDPIHWATVNSVQELYGMCKMTESSVKKLALEQKKGSVGISQLKAENRSLKKRLLALEQKEANNAQRINALEDTVKLLLQSKE